MLRKVLNLMIAIGLLIVGLTSYADGGGMAVRLINVPIPGWIFFPVVLLMLVGSILSLIAKEPTLAERAALEAALQQAKEDQEQHRGRSTVVCPDCGHENGQYETFCRVCSADLTGNAHEASRTVA